jgi:hypothetical protein
MVLSQSIRHPYIVNRKFRGSEMACPVCFGGEDAAMRESLNAGIGVLMGVTTIVLACFARLFLTLARRSREAAHLVEEKVTQ